MTPIECTDCGREIGGLTVAVDDSGIVRGEKVGPRYEGRESFVKLVVYRGYGDEAVSLSEYRHARCLPFSQQVQPVEWAEKFVPDTVEELVEYLDYAPTPPAPKLLDALRTFVKATPLDDTAGHAKEQGWQFAVDTYRQWAQLDLRSPAALDASLMTLVHVRNAMYANGVWQPETHAPSRIVFTMLRIFADERLRQS
jgi:hypothetical protein